MKTILTLILITLLILPNSIQGQNQRQESVEELIALVQKTDELIKAGRYEEAILQAEKLLQKYEQVFGEGDLNAEPIVNRLSMLYYKTGRYSEAVALLSRWLEKEEKSTDQKIKQLTEERRYDEAISHAKKSLEIKERMLGEEHPVLLGSVDMVVKLYYETGRYAEAEPLYKRSLEIREKALGRDHPDVATDLNNLAEVYRSAGRYAEAEPLYRRSLDIHEKTLGRNHPSVATILSNLAVLYNTTGRYAKAEPLYKRSLEIREEALAKDHPDVAISLNNLALVYEATGHYAEAEPLLKRSLEIYEKTLGRDHPIVARMLSNLAVFYGNTERPIDSHSAFIRSTEISEKKRENVFLLLSEKQKVNYMEQEKGVIHGFISQTTRCLRMDNRAVMETFDAWLSWKGAVMEAQGRYIDAFAHSKNPEIKKKFDDLSNIRREIARLQLTGPGKMNPQEYKERLEELEKKKEVLEVELSRLSKDFALEKIVGRADTKRISEILRKKGNNSIYIDFASIHIYDFKEKKWGKSRYLVFVLLPDKEPFVKLVDLSDAEELDGHIQTYLEEMKRAKEYGELPKERILKAEAKSLYDLLIKPLEPDILDKKHLYISPDGNLNLIPFEVLMSPEGRYLMEEYNITYIAAGRDIMRFTDETRAKGEALIIADPDYDMGLQEKLQVAKALGVVETRGPAPLSRDAKDLRFRRLPDTKQEADAIEKCLKESPKIDVKNYQDKKALEEVLFKAKNPRLLHLATHGYFLKDEEVKHQPQIMGLISMEKERFVDPGIENPMLRSGIVLAGANASLKEGRDDGVVSADKILGLRLKGTDLVVLSACETGVGDVKSGEGVFGLKRSFILSGAKTVVMSLWSIPSKETTELMTDFYTLMAKGKTKAEALREAQLNLMKKKPNPFYWGAFIMVGNPS